MRGASVVALALLLWGVTPATSETPPALEPLREALSFHCSFDNSADADFARGDRLVYTLLSGNPVEFKPGLLAEHTTLEETGGRHGGTLRFTRRSDQFLFYRGVTNIAYNENDFGGTFAVWLSLHPDEDLESFSDPIHISDASEWFDATIFIDFLKREPSIFRFGALADHKVWNPEKKNWSELPESAKPHVVVKKAPFRRDRWTHVVFTYAGFNRPGKEAVGHLYLNGEHQGELSGFRQVFTWDLETLAIRLGVNYVGRFDDLAVFDRALSADEVKALYALPNGVVELHPEEPQTDQKAPGG